MKKKQLRYYEEPPKVESTTTGKVFVALLLMYALTWASVVLVWLFK